MEYLVTMTTRVPDGVAEREIDEVRARESAHTHDLARKGRVLRLWRPPLGPGEWRTLGLFTAVDQDELEKVLESMPLRVWRTDEVTPLAPHPNDPGREAATVDRASTEFLTTFVVDVPSGTNASSVEEVTMREAERASQLAAEGHLIRLWRLPGEGRNFGHWQAEDGRRVRELLAA